MMNLCLGGGEEEMEALMQGMMSDNTQKLTSAVSSLPALLEKKRKIDMHMSMATSVLEQVKLRKLDVFYELEEKALSASPTAAQSDSLWQQVKEVLEDPEAGTPKDRMRLFLVYFLCHPALSDQDVERLCGVLEVSGLFFEPSAFTVGNDVLFAVEWVGCYATAVSATVEISLSNLVWVDVLRRRRDVGRRGALFVVAQYVQFLGQQGL